MNKLRLHQPSKADSLDPAKGAEQLKKVTRTLFYMQIWLLPIACLLVLGIVGIEPYSKNLMLHFSYDAVTHALSNRWPLLAGLVLLVLHIGRVITYIEQRVSISG